MERWQKELDNWLTTEPEGGDMFRVTPEELTFTDEHGLSVPMCVDELSCEDCHIGVGWESHGGTFVEFFMDPSDTHYKCEDCHREWQEDLTMDTNFTCPRCGDVFRRCYPALSRVDNKTPICPDCGTQEGLDDYYYGYVDPREYLFPPSHWNVEV